MARIDAERFLTNGYDQRTALVSLRYIFGTIGALVMKIVAYRVFLQPGTDDAAGVLNRPGYAWYGITAAIIIAIAFLAATMGTHSRIPFLHRPRKRKITFAGMAREIAATLNNRSWMALMAAGVFAGTTSTLHPVSTSWSRIERLIPKSYATT